ncbi:MAG: LysE/ArgO family amino acid transporter [Pseudomonadota bacterium]
MVAAALQGFALGASLIIAIGAQNAFILRQGLLRAHVLVLCLICALSDALLIAAGVAGAGVLIAGRPVLLEIVTWGGAAFLLTYAALALRRALRPEALRAGEAVAALWPAVLTALALTWLNPHVYLDTVILLGALSAEFEGPARLAYGAGAVLSSFVWFFALGYGARLLAPVFARPAAWRILDLGIAAVMTAIAISLIWPRG